MTCSAAELTVAKATGDGAITADRKELKFLVPAERSAGFLRVLHRRLLAHRFTGPGANLLPEAQHFSTTVYFDTKSHALLRAARASDEESVKLRAREYYDLHPSLAEVATTPEQIVRYQPWVWFELKRRTQDRTLKHRLRLEKAKLPLFLGGESGSAGATWATEIRDAELIREFCRGLGEPLEPSVLVNYRRQAFQDGTGTLRVTVDLQLSFYAPPADLWTRERALVRGTFGAARAVDDVCLVEVKLLAGLPAWLERALSEVDAQAAQFSKFVRAGQAVYGAV